MTRKLVGQRRIRNRQFPGLKVFYYEDQLDDGRLVYTSLIDITNDDRIVIDGRTQQEVEEKTESTLHVALYCRQHAAAG